MDERQEKQIIRTLVSAGHEPLAKKFARSRGYRVVARDELLMRDGKTHYWPEVNGWDGAADRVDNAGYPYQYEYEYDEDSRLKVVFDGANLQRGKPGTWETVGLSDAVLGKSHKGTWSNEKAIVRVLGKIAGLHESAKQQRIQKTDKQLKRVPGWEREYSYERPDVVEYNKTADWSRDFKMSITFIGLLNETRGSRRWYARMSDYGGEKASGLVDLDGTYSELYDIPTIVRVFGRQVEKLRETKGW